MAQGEPPYCNIHPMRAIFVIPNRPPATLKEPVSAQRCSSFSKRWDQNDGISLPGSHLRVYHLHCYLLQEKWSETFNNFIASCLVKDATKRPTADDLLKHPFVSTHVGELSLTGRSVELASFVDEHLAAVSARRKKSGNNQVRVIVVVETSVSGFEW